MPINIFGNTKQKEEGVLPSISKHKGVTHLSEHIHKEEETLPSIFNKQSKKKIGQIFNKNNNSEEVNSSGSESDETLSEPQQKSKKHVVKDHIHNDDVYADALNEYEARHDDLHVAKQTVDIEKMQNLLPTLPLNDQIHTMENLTQEQVIAVIQKLNIQSRIQLQQHITNKAQTNAIKKSIEDTVLKITPTQFSDLLVDTQAFIINHYATLAQMEELVYDLSLVERLDLIDKIFDSQKYEGMKMSVKKTLKAQNFINFKPEYQMKALKLYSEKNMIILLNTLSIKECLRLLKISEHQCAETIQSVMLDAIKAKFSTFTLEDKIICISLFHDTVDIRKLMLEKLDVCEMIAIQQYDIVDEQEMQKYINAEIAKIQNDPDYAKKSSLYNSFEFLTSEYKVRTILTLPHEIGLQAIGSLPLEEKYAFANELFYNFKQKKQKHNLQEDAGIILEEVNAAISQHEKNIDTNRIIANVQNININHFHALPAKEQSIFILQSQNINNDILNNLSLNMELDLLVSLSKLQNNEKLLQKYINEGDSIEQKKLDLETVQEKLKESIAQKIDIIVKQDTKLFYTLSGAEQAVMLMSIAEKGNDVAPFLHRPCKSSQASTVNNDTLSTEQRHNLCNMFNSSHKIEILENYFTQKNKERNTIQAFDFQNVKKQIIKAIMPSGGLVSTLRHNTYENKKLTKYAQQINKEPYQINGTEENLVSPFTAITAYNTQENAKYQSDPQPQKSEVNGQSNNEDKADKILKKVTFYEKVQEYTLSPNQDPKPHRKHKQRER